MVPYNSQLIGEWSGLGKGYPPFGFGISGVAIDQKRDIYVADWPNPAIYVFRTRPK